jgi:hypothetical protein
MIHGVLISCNLETVTEYADRVFELANGRIDVNQVEKSWLTICAFHKMRRIIPMIDSFNVTNLDLRRLAIFSFTLLLNSKTMQIISEYFELMCYVFLSKRKTTRVNIAFESMVKILSERPEELKQIKKIISKTEKSIKLQNKLTNNSEIYTALHITETSDDEDEEEMKVNEEEEKEEQKRTIKEKSPFTKVFCKIYERCVSELKNENENSSFGVNKYFFPAYVEKLLDEHLPYCFLWSSFAFRNLNFSRITNSNIENYNRFRKERAQLNKLPHRYIDSNYKMVSGCCIEFKEKLTGQTKSTKVSKKTSNKKISSMHGPIECNQYQATETFKKPQKKPPAKDVGYQNSVFLTSIPTRDIEPSLSFGNSCFILFYLLIFVNLIKFESIKRFASSAI